MKSKIPLVVFLCLIFVIAINLALTVQYRSLVVKERALLALLQTTREQLNRDIESDAKLASFRFSQRTNSDGVFSVSTYMDTNGISRQMVYVSGKDYLDFPYRLPLMKFSDDEWGWMTNHIRKYLVTGTNAEQNVSVFTELH